MKILTDSDSLLFSIIGSSNNIVIFALDREKAKGNFNQALGCESFTLIEEYGECPNRFYYEDVYSPVFDYAGRTPKP